MKVFITGGLGQIGSHLAEMLLDRGDQVLVVDNLATGRSEHLVPHPNLRVVIDSIANREAMQALMGDFRPDAVVHTAASYKDPHDWYNDTLTNWVGGSAIASLAKEFGGGRIIYYQTALCYGLKPLENPITSTIRAILLGAVTRSQRQQTSSTSKSLGLIMSPLDWPM